MKTWYHCIDYFKDKKAKVWGFSVKDGVICDHPDRFFIGKTIEQYKPFLIKSKTNVYKV